MQCESSYSRHLFNLKWRRKWFCLQKQQQRSAARSHWWKCRLRLWHDLIKGLLMIIIVPKLCTHRSPKTHTDNSNFKWLMYWHHATLSTESFKWGICSSVITVQFLFSLCISLPLVRSHSFSFDFILSQLFHFDCLVLALIPSEYYAPVSR